MGCNVGLMVMPLFGMNIDERAMTRKTLEKPGRTSMFGRADEVSLLGLLF